MTGRERVLRAIHGLPTDRPVVAPYMGNYGIRTAGSSLSSCYLDAASMAQAQLKAWNIFGQDVIVVQSDNYYMAEAFGAPVAHAPDAMPVLLDAVVKSPQDVYRLQPVDPSRDGRMPVYIEAVARICDTVSDQVAIRGCGTGPFVLAGHLCGIERLLLWLVETDTGMEDHAKELHHLFSLGLETLVRYATAQLESGATIIQLADSLASLQVISPAMYRSYVFPYEQAFFTRMKPICTKYQAAALLHICGDNTTVFDDYARTGADIIAIDHGAHLADAVRIIANRACIIGNMNPSGVLLSGTPEQVTAEACQCLHTAAGSRYLLGTGCEVAVGTPVANMRAMLATVHASTHGGSV